MLVQNFVKVNGVEYAVSVGHENISLFPTIEKAMDTKNEAAEMLKKKGYKVVGSGPDNDDPLICYWSRYENDQDRVVVFTIMRKTVEGDLFQY